MVVVLDCRGGSSMGLTRHMGLLKRLAVTLNQHYPVRAGWQQQQGMGMAMAAPACRSEAVGVQLQAALLRCAAHTKK